MISSASNGNNPSSLLSSLRAQLGLFLLLLAITAGAIFLLGWMPKHQSAYIEDQRRQVEEHLATLTDALLPYLIQDQMGAVHETLDALLERQPDWLVLTLADSGGKRLYPLFSPEAFSQGTTFEFSRAIDFRGRNYGELALVMDAEPLLANSRQRSRELTLLFFGVMLTAFVFIALFLELVAGRPARQLARAAEGLAEGDYESALPEPGRNEVGELVRNFDQMRDTIRAKEASLIDARRQAETANRAKSMFLANMSHELRTPLNSVLGFAQLMEIDPEATGRQKERLEIIRRSGEHLLDLLNDLLDLSRIESGSTSLALEPLDTRLLSAGIEGMFRQRADEKDLDFSVKTATSVPETVISDGRKIRQMLLNLVGNAVKFTQSGSVWLDVRWHPEGCLEFEVRDTGPGISPDKLESIFKPFDRGDQEDSNEDGAGLGLAICKRFVEHMGGTIRVKSRTGEGSTFTATIPVTPVEEAGDSPSELPENISPDQPSEIPQTGCARIPAAALRSLADASARLDYSDVQAGLDEIRRSDPATHERLSGLAAEFRYDELEARLLEMINHAHELPTS